MSTSTKLADQFAAAWTTKARGEDTIWILRDDAPEAFTDAVHDAHDALDASLPCDWIYEACAHLAEHLGDDEDLDTETCYGMVEVYTGKLYLWAAENVWARDLADQTLADSSSIARAFVLAQYHAYTLILQSLRGSLGVGNE